VWFDGYWGCNFGLCKKGLSLETQTQNDHKTSKLGNSSGKMILKSRQKDPPLFPLHKKIRRHFHSTKRSANIPTSLSKDFPSHKGVKL